MGFDTACDAVQSGLFCVIVKYLQPKVVMFFIKL